MSEDSEGKQAACPRFSFHESILEGPKLCRVGRAVNTGGCHVFGDFTRKSVNKVLVEFKLRGDKSDFDLSN